MKEKNISGGRNERIAGGVSHGIIDSVINILSSASAKQKQLVWLTFEIFTNVVGRNERIAGGVSHGIDRIRPSPQVEKSKHQPHNIHIIDV